MTRYSSHHRAHLLAHTLKRSPAIAKARPVVGVLRRARGAVLVTLAVALAGVAFPYNLQDLLRLPLERLLQLEISAPPSTSGAGALNAASKTRSPRG